jgi:hypothetical protein
MEHMFLHILKKDKVNSLSNDLLRIVFVQDKDKDEVIPIIN